MERDVREFLGGFSPDQLVRLGVLRSHHGPHIYVLQGPNVDSLERLMREEGVTKLVSADGIWSLSIEEDGVRFRNRWNIGLVRELSDRDRGDVFRKQNKHINPYYVHGSNSRT